MLAGLAERLAPVFADGEPTLLTDDPELADWLGSSGLPVLTFDDLTGRDALPTRIVAVPLDYGRIPSRRVLRDVLSGSSVLWVPLASFSPDLSTARYAVEKLLEVDFTRSVANNRHLICRLMLARGDVTFSGPGTKLALRLPEVLQLSSRTRVDLLPDEHSTVGNYFEVAFSPADLAGRLDAGMSVSGTLRVDSVLVAKHRELRGRTADQFTAATRVAEEMRRACPLNLSIVDSRIVGGLGPFADDIEALSGPEYRGAVTEVAIGTGALAPDGIDWSLNCLLNESAAGIHLGVGNGLTGMHFDFLATEAVLDG
ncbi:hypothetical protein SK571_40495 [Lentzea sp. BCCO 10_0798]|uniref:Crocagin biosynthetic protein CgnE/B domain-containing protein n=1 Tax=Lentzea kristufekii TaxID=3095430 RepID=A0ABU4U605_9PSEU|nr:hypothetical protein [Lentzea sp. BCCO 10_0798]MDX8055694.1 hypothetical protein [Lentzea sp. BCCO 10_0798]